VSVAVDVIETDDAGIFPWWPMWLRCDRCGAGHQPYYANQADYDKQINVHRRAAHVVRKRGREAGWDAPGFGGFDVCPPCGREIEQACAAPTEVVVDLPEVTA
jgi:hypothetical protein